MVEQWCRAVPKRSAEAVRRELMNSGLLDRRLRPTKDGENILFPVTDENCADFRADFESTKVQEELPRHELIGGIAIMQDNDRAEARRLLASRPVIHTVLHSESAVEGEFRTREFSVLAGKETTATQYTEYGLSFTIDLAVAYFSARLANERRRIVRQMAEGERVLDMFAGVGPFAIALAEKAEVVYAGDINPGAVHLMIKNIQTNRKRNVIPILADACHLPGVLLDSSFDRIVMNLPMTSTAFIEAAIRLSREGGHIHFYTLQSETGEMLPMLRKYTKGRISEKVVRSYSPAQHHAVYDIEVKKGEFTV